MDKLKHLLVSAGLVIGLSFFMPLVLAVIVTMAVGIGKELTDKYIDIWDLAADVVGVLFAIAICSIK